MLVYSVDMGQSIIQRLPPDVVKAYQKYEMTSFEVAKIAGCNPASVRRGIKRKRIKPKYEKSDLIKARKLFRATLVTLSVEDIAIQANVSLSTARRIKQRGQNQ